MVAHSLEDGTALGMHEGHVRRTIVEGQDPVVVEQAQQHDLFIILDRDLPSLEDSRRV